MSRPPSAILPVILSGGAGSRLWPVSREAFPKPFMRLPDGESLLQKTLRRAAPLTETGEVLTVTNREYLFRSRDDYAEVLAAGPKVATPFILEPVGRNTAPAICLAALRARAVSGADTVLLVLASDHLIEDQAAFADAARAAAARARTGSIVTFGVTPTGPATGFGYIEVGESLGASEARVKRFVEKPDHETAQRYVESGGYLWNTGMFCLRADTLLKALSRHAPEVLAAAEEAWKAASDSRGELVELEAAAYSRAPDISIDYAVLEKSTDLVVVKGKFGWSDIGSWTTMSELTRPDERGNRVMGEAVVVDTRNTYIHSENRLVAAVGVENLIIVDTPDAVLIADRERTQDVKKVVDHLKLIDHATHKFHRTIVRPWGSFTVLEEGKGFKIKRLEVKPGAALSLQMHHHRSEHWIVVEGLAKVTNGDRELLVRKNESTFILAGNRHRLENPGMVNLVVIEVQSGDYLGEDDIVRFNDRYGRAPADSLADDD